MIVFTTQRRFYPVLGGTLRLPHMNMWRLLALIRKEVILSRMGVPKDFSHAFVVAFGLSKNLVGNQNHLIDGRSRVLGLDHIKVGAAGGEGAVILAAIPEGVGVAGLLLDVIEQRPH